MRNNEQMKHSIGKRINQANTTLGFALEECSASYANPKLDRRTSHLEFDDTL